MKRTRILPILLAAILLIAAIPFGIAAATSDTAQGPRTGSNVAIRSEGETMTAPKYVFLFIGDGMTYPSFKRPRLT